MEYARLRKAGMQVSRLCQGCMSYGKSSEGMRWQLDEEQSRPYFQRALEMREDEREMLPHHTAGE